jgi:hypothetical protein
MDVRGRRNGDCSSGRRVELESRSLTDETVGLRSGRRKEAQK